MRLLGGLAYQCFANKVAFVNEKSLEDKVTHLCFFAVCFVSIGSGTYSSSRVSGYVFSPEPHFTLNLTPHFI
jgi:hypothetical protein